MTIKTIEDLRNQLLIAFEQFVKKEITVQDASAVAKLGTTVIAGVKAEMDYWEMTNQAVNIPFMESPNTRKIIEHKPLEIEDKSHESK